MKYSTLCFGTRGDAGTWEKGCQDLGITCGKSVRSPLPTMEDMKSFFVSQGNWLFFGGHFAADQLFNDGDSDVPSSVAGLQFDDNDVMKIASGTKRHIFRKNSVDFNLDNSAKVILWGGCSTLNNPNRIRKLHGFFNGVLANDLVVRYGIKEAVPQAITADGADTATSVKFKEAPLIPASSSTRYSTAMLGFKHTTGWRIVDNALGGSDGKGFFSRIKSKNASHSEMVEAWLAGALDTYRNNDDILNRFAAVDATGQEWHIEGDKIVRGYTV